MIFDGKHEIPVIGNTVSGIVESIVELVPDMHDLSGKGFMMSDAEESALDSALGGMLWGAHLGRRLLDRYSADKGQLLEGVFGVQLTFPGPGKTLLTYV